MESGTNSAQTVVSLLLALWKAGRPWVFRLTLLATLLAGGLAWLVKHHAESNLLTVFLSYLPPWVAALPFFATSLLALLFLCWRSMLVSVATAVYLVCWLGGFNFAKGGETAGSPPASMLRLMSYNRGQGSREMAGVFAEKFQPDIAVFQDAGRRLQQLAALPQFAAHSHHVQDGEFIMLSKWPVMESRTLTSLREGGAQGKPAQTRAYGSRALVDWQGRPVAIYNIHFPTPRDLLYWYARRGTFFYGILGLVPGTVFHARHQEYLATWVARVRIAEEVSQMLRNETVPVVLLGDLNFPSAGKGYQCLAEVMRDAHSVAGEGFGHTFPGDVRSTFAKRFAPWIRIDHIFTSAEWRISSCEVASEGYSQHLPVGVAVTLR